LLAGLDEGVRDGRGDNDDEEGGGGENYGYDIGQPGVSSSNASDPRPRGLRGREGGREGGREKGREGGGGGGEDDAKDIGQPGVAGTNAGDAGMGGPLWGEEGRRRGRLVESKVVGRFAQGLKSKFASEATLTNSTSSACSLSPSLIPSPPLFTHPPERL